MQQNMDGWQGDYSTAGIASPGAGDDIERLYFVRQVLAMTLHRFILFAGSWRRHCTAEICSPGAGDDIAQVYSVRQVLATTFNK